MTICLRDRPDPLPTMENILDEIEEEMHKKMYYWNFEEVPIRPYQYKLIKMLEDECKKDILNDQT